MLLNAVHYAVDKFHAALHDCRQKSSEAKQEGQDHVPGLRDQGWHRCHDTFAKPCDDLNPVREQVMKSVQNPLPATLYKSKACRDQVRDICHDRCKKSDDQLNACQNDVWCAFCETIRKLCDGLCREVDQHREHYCCPPYQIQDQLNTGCDDARQLLQDP